MDAFRWSQGQFHLRGQQLVKTQRLVPWRKVLSLQACVLPSIIVCLILCIIYLLSIEPVPQEIRYLGPPRAKSCNACLFSDFPILVNYPEICSQRGDTAIDMVVFVESHPNNLDARTAVRNTWLTLSKNNTSNFRHVFIFGQVSNLTQMRLLEEEGQRFRDIVISQFEEDYMNLTLKTLVGMRWVTRFCSRARYFFKADDDTWVNLSAILPQFDTNQALSTGDVMMGRCTMSSYVIRDPNQKWYASFESYPEEAYPHYCGGTGYGGRLSIAERVVNVSQDVPFFHLEDVYVGLCLRELEIPVIHLKGIHADPPSDPCRERNRSNLYHPVQSALMYELWNPVCGKENTSLTTTRPNKSFLQWLLSLFVLFK